MISKIIKKIIARFTPSKKNKKNNKAQLLMIKINEDIVLVEKFQDTLT